jgi:thiol-disulfide isomerase/thioredoxin
MSPVYSKAQEGDTVPCRITIKTGITAAAALLLTLCGCSERAEVVTASPAVIRRRIAASDAPVLVVHAWATWCVPCRDEFPELMNVCRTYLPKGVDVLLVSADAPDETAVVRRFLQDSQSPVGTLLAADLGQAFMESLSPTWSGTLPATFLYTGGNLRDQWEGPRDFEHYADRIDLLLKD